MAKWKIFNWKTLAIILTIIIIPLIIGYMTNILSWKQTRARVEITLKLDSWKTIASYSDSDLQNLKLTHNEKPIKNVLKMSWRIINTGTEGIEKFEVNPSILYPENTNIASAFVSEFSGLLKIDRTLSIDYDNRNIKVDNIGIFNPGEFFKIDIYVIDSPSTSFSTDVLYDWNLMSKAKDLKIKKDMSYIEVRKDFISFIKKYSNYLSIFFVFFSTLLLIFVTRLINRAMRVYERAKEISKETADLHEHTAAVLSEMDEKKEGLEKEDSK